MLENYMADDETWWSWEHRPDDAEPRDDDYDMARDMWDEEHEEG